MNMHDHLLAALTEQLQRWEALLARLSAEQATALPILPNWSPKDLLVHLWGWQQISVARVEAALHDRQPEFPAWVSGLPEHWEDAAAQTNAWLQQTYQALPWSRVHQQWRTGFQRFLELSGRVSERDLLDGSRYPWLDGRPLALILLASYDHHQEHYEQMRTWMDARENAPPGTA